MSVDFPLSGDVLRLKKCIGNQSPKNRIRVSVEYIVTSAVPVERETLKSGRDDRRTDTGRTDVKVEIFM